MKTFEGKQIRLIRDRDVVVVQSNTNRRIVVKSPIMSSGAAVSASVFMIEPYQYLLCTGRSLRQSGLIKEMDRSAIIVDQVVKDAVAGLSDIVRRHLSRDSLVALDKQAAEALRAVSAAGLATAEAEKAAEEKRLAIENAERNKQVTAELDKRVADHEQFEAENRVNRGPAPVSLDQAVALHQEILSEIPVPTAEEITEPVAETTEPVVPAPTPDLKLVPEAIPDAEVKVNKKSRPKKRD